MKTEFQAKYLQHLLKKKKENEGFTLIELLVVVVIIGILAAIALPNLIGQIAKSRETDARNTLGALNRSQQANYVETDRFSSDLGNLNVSTTSQYYSYAAGNPGTGTFVAMTANSLKASDNVKSYGSGVATANNEFSFILCSTPGKAPTGPTVTTTADCGGAVKIKQ